MPQPWYLEGRVEVCCFGAHEDAGKTAKVDGSGGQYGAFWFYPCTLRVQSTCDSAEARDCASRLSK